MSTLSYQVAPCPKKPFFQEVPASIKTHFSEKPLYWIFQVENFLALEISCLPSLSILPPKERERATIKTAITVKPKATAATIFFTRLLLSSWRRTFFLDAIVLQKIFSRTRLGLTVFCIQKSPFSPQNLFCSLNFLRDVFMNFAFLNFWYFILTRMKWHF